MVETSVILLNYNGLHLLKKALPPLLKQSYKDYEIILIDNGSTDGSKEWIEQHYKAHPQVRYKHIMPNRGYTGGNNCGARMAKGKYVVMLSNDSVVEKKWLEKLIDCIKNEKDAGIIGSYNLTQGSEKEALDRLHKEKKFVTMNLFGELISTSVTQEKIDTDVLEGFFLAGNGLAYKKECMSLPFDETYFIYAEDVYICWLAHLTGWKVKQKLSARISHVGAASKNLSKKINTIAVFNGAKNQFLNYFLFYSTLNVWRILPLFMFVQCTYLLYRPRELITRLKAWFWVATHIPLIRKKRKSIQAKRTVSDEVIVAKLSCLYLSGDSPYVQNNVQRVLVKIINKLFFAYSWLFGIRTREFL